MGYPLGFVFVFFLQLVLVFSIFFLKIFFPYIEVLLKAHHESLLHAGAQKKQQQQQQYFIILETAKAPKKKKKKNTKTYKKM